MSAKTPQSKDGSPQMKASAEEEVAAPSGTNASDNKLARSGAQYTITEEALVILITKVCQASKPSKVYRYLAHPLVVVVIGGIIAAIIGGIVTSHYTSRQKDIDDARSQQQQKLASRRSFFDELNKIRIQKIGEMWEKIDTNEVVIDGLFKAAAQSSSSKDQRKQNVNVIKSLIQEDLVTMNKNRFWLAEENYNKAREYFDTNVELALNVLLAEPGTDLTDILEKREKSKQDIIEVRQSMLSEDDLTK
jgi:hypothetical protein